nr:transposase domain-containing protein [uncultured Oscillibacter sp.]
MGTQSSAIVYSLIETAKENGLDPYGYLVSVFEKAPGLEGKEHPERLHSLLPTKQ